MKKKILVIFEKIWDKSGIKLRKLYIKLTKILSKLSRKKNDNFDKI